MIANHVHKGSILEVHDGDTFRAMVELDFFVLVKARIRVRGLYCAEFDPKTGKGQPDGKEAYLDAVDLLPVGQTVMIQSFKDEQSFTRWVCDVWVTGGPGVEVNFREAMTIRGHNGKGVGA